ncbi:MAG TPA: ATP-binding protein [Kofleriaceae bacterium]|nr:ATP-binding protein [Kofleriaceae bacterium]
MGSCSIETANQVAMSRSGRFVAFRQPDGLHVVDVLGPAPRRVIDVAPDAAFACTATELWFAHAGSIVRTPLGGDDAITSYDLPGVTRLVPCAPSVVAESRSACTLVEPGGPTTATSGERIVCGAGRRVVTTGATTALRTFGRDDAVALPVRDPAIAGAWLFGGRAIALWLRGERGDAIVACTPSGKLIHRIDAPSLTACAFAEDGGSAVGIAGSELCAFDLRYGQLRGTCSEVDAVDVAIDALGRRLVLARGAGAAIAVSVLAMDEAFRERVAAVPVTVDLAPAVEAVPAPVPAPIPDPAPVPDALPDLVPLALAPPVAAAIDVEPTDAPPYLDADAHLAALLDVVAARAALVIAEGWHSGRTSHDAGGLPCEREVLGLLGEDVGLAADALAKARLRLASRAAELAARTRTTLAIGIALPFVDIAREHALSPIATQILACVAAPKLRGRIARLYGVLAGLSGRTACLDHLLEPLVEAEPGRSLGHTLATELAPDAPLLRGGLVAIQPHADRTLLVIDDVLADRLRGIERVKEISIASERRTTDRTLAEVVAPLDVKRSLVFALADRDRERPARVVLRGRGGSGRHTLFAALAARVDRTIAAIDCGRLPRGDKLPPALALELVRAQLAGAVPIVSGLETLDRGEAELRRALADVLRRHPGPLAVRAAPEADLPLDADRIDVTLPPLSLGERIDVWRRALAARDLAVPDDGELELLATRFRFGPGTIERVADQVVRRTVRDPSPLAIQLDAAARQHVAGRLERVASRITRLADWDQVTLLDEMRDSVRELIGRMRYQRTVYEEWGFDRRIHTARGLTALFYGPPGTGKTLVAGLIGRELGLDVWRIDLARVMSKWIGETEKSLAEVFEAAEEGQVLLLFDEADSLFGKRSEVKSSNDRYANVETNYLLQRLDSFEGVAILTTNLEGSIDPAFKRRLSMRLYFPFPDEELRAELWAAHVPPSVPSAGSLDFTDLARRYPLSGGYIRNSALRAAFLAAQERRPLSQDHLVRAVQLEYRELGKLSTSGRMD